MEYTEQGKIVKLTGGLYTVRLAQGETPLSGRTVLCRARGSFRHERTSPLVGDEVIVRYADVAAEVNGTNPIVSTEGGGAMIERILPRKNSLIRPPLANLDCMLVVAAAAFPAPDFSTLDKLLAILEFNHIEPVVVVGKAELNHDMAACLTDIYTKAGYRVFTLSCRTGEGVEAFSAFAGANLSGKTTAVAGASGVGKSTLLNTVFPGLTLRTGDISRRIARGKNTTRHTELYSLPLAGGEGYIADTAGFSLLDFEHFVFFGLDDLAGTFREFAPYLGSCRYTDCTHLSEEGCAVVEAVRDGRIASSRHESYRSLYAVLKEKKKWEKKVQK